MDQHVPDPKPMEDWDVEDHIKFRMFSDNCPMCKYKHEYAILHSMIQAAHETDDENLKGSLLPTIQQKQAQLIEIGLFIATSVDENSKYAGQSQHN